MIIRVRRAVPRDAETIARQSQAANREEGHAGSTFDVEHVRNHAFGAAPLIEIMVVEQNNQLLGHTIAYKGYDIRFASPTMILAELYVAPEARRLGVARRLISAVARRAREQGCRRVHITTGLDNSVAHRFYSAIGAKEERSAHFLLTSDAIEWLAAEGA